MIASVSGTAVLAIDAPDAIGEGPAWDAAGERLIWSDNATGLVHEASRRRRRVAGDARHPCAPSDRRRGPVTLGGLVVVSGVDVLFLADDGWLTPFARIDDDPERVSLNDAKCDARGRLWAGTVAKGFVEGGPGSIASIRMAA